VLAGGPGDKSDRITQYATDAAAVGKSPWGLRELFTNASNEKEAAGVLSQAQSALSKSRAIRSFSAELAETPSCRFQVDWDKGDMLTVSYQGAQFDVVNRTLEVSRSTGGEQIAAKVEIVT